MKFILLAVLIAAVSAAKLPRGAIEPEVCGGDGFPLEMRVTDCDAIPCQLTPDKAYLIEGDFIASADSDGLSFKLTVIIEGYEFVGLDVEIPNSAVQTGGTYTIAYPLTPDPTSSGFHVDLKVEVYDTVSKRVELCVAAPADIL